MNYYIKVIAGFIVLDLFLNMGIAKSNLFLLQVLLVLLFFPLLKGILLFTKVKEFRNIGISFHPKWWKNVVFGFMIGFSFWLMKYLLFYLFGGFEIASHKSYSDIILTLLRIMLTFLVGSFLNDIVVRGYVFGHLKESIPVKWVFFISLIIYVLDDSWNEGFSISNMLFSLILGLSLTYAIYKTGSLWADTGIHWGLNVCYGIFNGTLGSSNGGIIITIHEQQSMFLEMISYIVPLIMFLFILLIRNQFVRQNG
ncbi:CPBP family intramembrane metalloprotease [Lysinibacillus yapensis]|uniref:CPBP family intramembrane metalloprotease n=1 Tax=Ureibacillus yapensis TaxID=2304605 RepID=A0A396SBH8_9BACL|nr:CPBP family intramembrane glutamic endopeptidase [Lysinibacillus yapensis]RHW38453.1 CPBP family intramembrane metalloprotease [Lysinibacillus yapensis]